LSNKSILDFWYFLGNIKDLGKSEFGILSDVMTKYMVLPHFCISGKSIFTCEILKQNKLPTTGTIKGRLLANQAL